MSRYYGYRPYVPVAKRRAQAAREVAKRQKKGEKISPVVVPGQKITTTFWGQAWCTNLESYSDFANRLPRGRTYVRNGSVVDLKIKAGKITALVSGSSLYEVKVEIAALSQQNWKYLKKQSAGKIGTLVELLQGKLSKGVMELVTDRQQGLFPKPREIKMRCSCPDYAGMCKHVAAVMYGIGNRLDSAPELLFALRGVDHQELIEQAIPAVPIRAGNSVPTIDADDLGAIFDIEIDDAPDVAAETKTRKKRVQTRPKKPAQKAAKPTKKLVKSAKKPEKPTKKAGRPTKNAGKPTKKLVKPEPAKKGEEPTKKEAKKVNKAGKLAKNAKTPTKKAKPTVAKAKKASTIKSKKKSPTPKTRSRAKMG